MSRKFNLDLDPDALKVVDPNEKPLDEKESNKMIDPNQEKLANTDVLLNENSSEVQSEKPQNATFEKVTEFIDANQISLTDEQQSIQTNELRISDFDSNKQELTKAAKNAKPVMNATLFFNLFFAIWLFVVSMVPPIASNVGDVTVIFTKPAQDSTLFGLTAVGYVNIILFTIPALILNITNLVLRLKTKNKYFTNAKKSARTCFEVFRYLLITSIILMSVNLLVPPFGINNGGSFYSLMYDTNRNIIAGWYVIIVLFSISISTFFVTLVVLNLLQTSLFNVEKIKERQANIKKYFEEVKKAKQQKKENKTKKKQILAEEEKLLNDLKEVSEEEKSLISEEEFQARIKSNNEIKNKIKELQKQQEELKKHQSAFLKKKRAQETINRRPLKPKKQEITIPDKELEEIFKNIELD